MSITDNAGIWELKWNVRETAKFLDHLVDDPM